IQDCFPEGKFLYIPYGNDTYYQGIQRLEPGHCLTITRGKISISPFWQLDPEVQSIHYTDPRDYLAHFTELLHEAIN
ncbi:hypothetical protein ACO1KX_13870, partial [Staphylococcus aureus]